MDKPILDPPVPYVGPIYGGRFSPGKMVRIQGTSPGIAYRFSVYLQCGPETVPRDDVAVQLTVRFLDGYISLNSSENGIWGEEQRGASLPIKPAEQFEIILICDFSQYKVEINGQHYCEFPQRMHYDRITHLAIDGDLSIVRINYETALLEGDNPAFSSEVDVNEEDEVEEPYSLSPVETENDNFEMIDFTNTMRLSPSVIRSVSVVEFSQMPSYEEVTDGSAFHVHSDESASFSYASAPAMETDEIPSGGTSQFLPTSALRIPPPPQHRALLPPTSASSRFHAKKSSNLMCWVLCIGAVILSMIIVVALFLVIKHSLKP